MRKQLLNDGTYMIITEEPGPGYLDFWVYIEQNGHSGVAGYGENVVFL